VIKESLNLGYNVKLARELTGWLINIKGPIRSEIMLTPEDELKEIINNYVPEIRNNEIEIVRLARIEGFGSRVVVRWASKNKRGIASQRCMGFKGERLKMI
jgi:transcription antitermination factor NusA-like protein